MTIFPQKESIRSMRRPFPASLKPSQSAGAIASCVLFAIAALAVAPVRAQDLGSLLRGVLQRQSPGDLSTLLRSITEVSSARLGTDVAPPSDAQGKVVLYRTASCGYCRQASAYMTSRNIPFVERDIEASAAYRAEYSRLNSQGGVPLLVFGTETMRGFAPAQFDQHYAQFKQTQQTAAAPSPASSGMQTMPSARNTPPQPGDALIGKIAGIKVHAEPSRTSRVLATLARTEEVIYMGQERDGLYLVTTPNGEGWVDRILVRQP